jgi:hypothetical protein
MNDILKTLKMIDSIESKNTLTESTVTECGDMGGMGATAPQNPGNPVTASITLNASGMDNVADLMKLIQNAGLQPQGPASAPTLPMRTDMEQLRDKMVGLEGPVSAPKEQYFDVDDVTGGGDDIHSKKHPADIRMKDAGSLADNIEEWENEPEEEYGDHTNLIKTLSGGINRQKKMYKPAAKGDNPMAVEGIKSQLLKALSEKKAKPDFLDMDKDGDKKEPMKKAVADKKKKAPVKENWSMAEAGGNMKQVLEQLEQLVEDADRLVRQLPIDEEVKGQLANQIYEYWTSIQKAADVIESSSNVMADGPVSSEAEVQAPTGEMDQTARKAMAVAQKIKRKINSGEQMDDRDYNQMAELGAVLSRLGTNFGPKSMKDVMAHMVQYTNDRNEEGHGYPEFDINRMKELIAMASSTGESAVSEISSDLAKRYTKRAKMDRDFNDDDLARLSRKVRYGTDDDARQASADMTKLQRRNAKRQRGINRAAKRM